MLFAIPWHDRTLVGTTDTAIDGPSYEPLPLEEEIEFVLDTARDYLSRPPSRADVLSVFVGIRGIAQENDSCTALLHPELPYIAAEIIWSVRHEMSRTLDDALARRTRALLLNARPAIATAPRVAALMAAELGRGPDWIERQVAAFGALARHYILDPGVAGAAVGHA